jgi:hypothetical protein
MPLSTQGVASMSERDQVRLALALAAAIGLGTAWLLSVL